MKLLEYSVIYTNRAVNLMSQQYIKSFQDLNKNLCQIYNARKSLIIPGSGSTAMEAVARHFGTNRTCMVIRNGNFSYRWSQIFEWGKPHNIANDLIVHKGNVKVKNNRDPIVKVSPPLVSKVYDSILKNKPDLFCVPHVETSTGVILDYEYIKDISNAVRKVGGLLCLDGIASGTMWIDMEKYGVDLYITAPQKGWSSPASCGVIMANERALDFIRNIESNSFILDLNKWLSVTESYESGNFMYHCTVPTDAIIQFSEAVEETLKFGLEKAEKNAKYIGKEIRKGLELRGFSSVADEDYKAPTVIVSQCQENMVPFFKSRGIQVTGYVPFMLDEPSEINTFRLGLFGLDKLSNPQKTVDDFINVLDN